jgi:hypothetical protein
MKLAPAPTVARSSAGRPLTRAVDTVRTELGHRTRGHGYLAAVDDALRSRRAGSRFTAGRRPAFLRGGS